MADSSIVVSGLTVTGDLGLLTASWAASAPSLPLPYLFLGLFEVYVASTNSRPGSPTATVFDTSYQVAGLAYSTTRYFWVRAVDVAGNFGDFYPLSATAGISGTTKAAPSATIGAGQVVTSNLNTGDSANMVPDNDMVDTNSWTGTFVFGTIGDGTGGRGSQNYLQLAVGAADVSSTQFPVEAGVDYFCGAGSNVSSNGNGTVAVYVDWFSDVAGSTLISSSTIRATTSSTWGSSNGIFTAPTGARRARYRIKRTTAGSNTATARAGALVMHRATNGEMLAALAVNTGHVADGAATTPKIADAAVTDANTASVNASYAVTNSFATIASLTVTAGDYSFPIGAYVDCQNATSVNGRTINFQLDVTISGTVAIIATFSQSFTGAVTAGGYRARAFLGGVIPPLPAGTYTVRLRVSFDATVSPTTWSTNYGIVGTNGTKK